MVTTNCHARKAIRTLRRRLGFRKKRRSADSQLIDPNLTNLYSFSLLACLDTFNLETLTLENRGEARVSSLFRASCTFLLAQKICNTFTYLISNPVPKRCQKPKKNPVCMQNSWMISLSCDVLLLRALFPVSLGCWSVPTPCASGEASTVMKIWNV